MEQPGAQRILVVDDDPPTRQGLLELLGAEFEVRSAADGIEAVELARAWGPDLVLMDVDLPSADGLTAHRELLSDIRTRRIPVIFISAPGDDLPVRCLDAGAADFVAKPVHGRELVARIKRVLRDGRERRSLEELAQTDALTGLANFRGLAERLGQEFHRASRYDYPVAVASIDLDHLKEINDRFGHEMGNRAIVALARYLREHLREADFAARYGGDEFVVILPHQSPYEATVFADRLRQGIKSLQWPATDPRFKEVEVTVSVGIAGDWREARKESAEALLEASDLALYEAKRRGRNQVVVYEQMIERRRLEAHRDA